MRQILTRVDDDLHARLKARAAAEGRSMNELMIEALQRQLDAGDDPKARLRARLAARGMLAQPSTPPPTSGLSRDEGRSLAIEELRGAGDAVLEALEWSRGPKD
jgi:plasmid stability protein